MVSTPRFSWLLLLILTLLMWALIGARKLDKVSYQLARDQSKGFAHQKRQMRPFQSHANEIRNEDVYNDADAKWDAQRMHFINIQATNLDEEERKEEKDRVVYQALTQMMKLAAGKVANRQTDRVARNVPGLDIRREFASDEANPYI